MTDTPKLKLPPRPDRRAIPNPGGVREYTAETGAVDKPHRPVVLTTKQRAELPRGIAPRAPFLPGVTQELPAQDLEAERAQVEADIQRRVETLEQLLEDPNLAEVTRQTITAEIDRLTAEG